MGLDTSVTLTGDIYGKRALDFVEDLQQLADARAISARIERELEWFGFSCVTIGDLPAPGVEPRVLMNTRPLDYSLHYQRENYFQKDPVVLALSRSFAPVVWSDVRKQKLSRRARTIIDEARDFGARDGLLIPIFCAAGTLSLFSPCGFAPDLSARARSALEIIGIYSYQALKRALHKNRELERREPLTNREREVMKWVAAGKTDDEIAMILCIARETVTTHVENAKRKLNAVRRTYAVVQALRVGEITL